MDPTVFDTLVRSFATAGTRRGLLRLLATVPVLGTLAVAGDGEAAAAKHGKHRPARRRTHHPQLAKGKRGPGKHGKGKGKRGKGKGKGKNKGKGKQGNPPGPPPGSGPTPNPNPCLPNGTACTQGGQCCSGNCFNFVCAAPVSQCPAGGTPIACSPRGTGCCANDIDCCAGPDNQCNPEGLCCAPNCTNRVCGGDGCGGTGTCGTCQASQVCDDDTGQCLCTPQSCPDGCCANGLCQPGDTIQACGTGGVACAACASGDGCLDQQCVACSPPCPPDLGLRCNGNGQCVCDAQSCPTGCCFSDSGGAICLTGKVDDFCGSGGASCVSCGVGASCLDQVCVCRAGLCAGCCEHGPDTPGRCLPNTPPVCGVDGNPCAPCPAGDGRTCNAQGQCVCTPQSCPNGCCDDNGLCQPGNTGQDCGTGGQACARCDTGQSCQNRVCACTPQSCPNGCCAADGTCQPGDTYLVCGGQGAPCASCNDRQTCQNRQCVACGSTCTCTGQSLCTDPGGENLVCSAPSDPNVCFCYVSQTGRPICGGSVTILEPNGCSSDAECGGGAACVANTGDSGPCGANGKPFCVGPCCQPDCAGKVCGPDGCGGSCGSCPGALVCDASGQQCVSPCTPQTCPSGCCAADGRCQPGTAKGACGQGGAPCQACGAGESCLGQQCEPCVAKTCAEAGVQCGPAPDGCGDTLQCGSCQLGDTPSCQTGDCVACADACPATCTACFQAPNGTTICGSNLVVSCSSPCSSDADCGGDSPTCIATAVQRGSGEAQTLADFCQAPGLVGACVAVAACCQPDCTGKTCGDDGCGGSCGACGQCQDCENGTCQATGLVCGDICCASSGEFCCTDAGPYCCDTSFVACCQGTCCS